MPETTYSRTATLISASVNNNDSGADTKLSDNQIEKSDPESLPTCPSDIPRMKSFWQDLKVYNGVYPSSASFMTLLVRPFVACVTPVCLWAGLIYGVAITWVVLIATSVSQIFSAPREYSGAS